MSKPGRIPVKAAERISREYRCPMVVVFAIQDDGKEFCLATYGATRVLCRHAADLGRQISAAILKGDIVPADPPPADLPGRPAAFVGKPRGAR